MLHDIYPVKYFSGSKLPGQVEQTWKRSLVCTDTCQMRLEHAPGAKPLVCIGLKEGLGGGGGKEWNVPFEYKVENEGGFQTK